MFLNDYCRRPIRFTISLAVGETWINDALGALIDMNNDIEYGNAPDGRVQCTDLGLLAATRTLDASAFATVLIIIAFITLNTYTYTTRYVRRCSTNACSVRTSILLFNSFIRHTHTRRLSMSVVLVVNNGDGNNNINDPARNRYVWRQGPVWKPNALFSSPSVHRENPYRVI